MERPSPFVPGRWRVRFQADVLSREQRVAVRHAQKDEQVELAIDGERVALLDINPRMLVTEELRTRAHQDYRPARGFCRLRSCGVRGVLPSIW